MNNVAIKVFKSKNKEGSIKGFCKLIFDDVFAITGIMIKENKEGELFVTMPQRKDDSSDTGYRDICFPTTKNYRKELTDAILSEYRALITASSSD